MFLECRIGYTPLSGTVVPASIIKGAQPAGSETMGECKPPQSKHSTPTIALILPYNINIQSARVNDSNCQARGLLFLGEAALLQVSRYPIWKVLSWASTPQQSIARTWHGKIYLCSLNNICTYILYWIVLVIAIKRWDAKYPWSPPGGANCWEYQFYNLESICTIESFLRVVNTLEPR